MNPIPGESLADHAVKTVKLLAGKPHPFADFCLLKFSRFFRQKHFVPRRVAVTVICVDVLCTSDHFTSHDRCVYGLPDFETFIDFEMSS